MGNRGIFLVYIRKANKIISGYHFKIHLLLLFEKYRVLPVN